jgi:DNA-binding MarR family transcriptional regulator
MEKRPPFWEDEIAETTLDALFARVAHLHHHRAVEYLEEAGLSFGQPPILFALWRRDGLTHNELSQHLGRTPATVTSTLRRMVRDGWVERRQDQEDRRSFKVFLTQRGRDIRAEVERKLLDLDKRSFEGFDQEDRNDMRRLLRMMGTNLRSR